MDPYFCWVCQAIFLIYYHKYSSLNAQHPSYVKVEDISNKEVKKHTPFPPLVCWIPFTPLSFSLFTFPKNIIIISKSSPFRGLGGGLLLNFSLQDVLLCLYYDLVPKTDNDPSNTTSFRNRVFQNMCLMTIRTSKKSFCTLTNKLA